MSRFGEQLPDAATVREILRELGLAGRFFVAWSLLVACLFLRADSRILHTRWWEIVGIWLGLAVAWAGIDGVARIVARRASISGGSEAVEAVAACEAEPDQAEAT